MVEARSDAIRHRRLRVGMVGGGIDAFIGAVHRFAIRLDDQAELVAGALSADADKAARSGAALGLAPERTYSDWREMARAEATRPDGIEAVVIVTPNHLHAPVALAFLEAGIDVICDKPLSSSLADALTLEKTVEQTGLCFFVTLNNTGYAMVRQMREMIANGDIGALRGIHCEYIQDWLSLPIDAEGQKQAEWRTDPERAGASAVLADIGVHAVNLAGFVTGLELEEVAAQLFTAVPGRRLDDNANVLLRWSGGVNGTLIASQTAPGHLNDLSVRIFGETGSLEWRGSAPEQLLFAPLGEPVRTIWRAGPGTSQAAQAVSRMPAAHPEGYIEGFGNFYRDAIAAIQRRRAGETTPPLSLPDVRDGVRGVRFVEAAVASNRSGGSWTRTLRP